MMVMMGFLLLLAIPVTSKLRSVGELKASNVNEDIMRKIFELCHADDNSANPIAMFGDFDGFIDKASIIRINKFYNIEDEKSDEFLSVKANVIVMIHSSPTQFTSDLKFFKKTKWWNDNASFYIVEKGGTCVNYEEILITTWTMNILNSIYICSESVNSSLLYTLNPLANYAPDPWRRVQGLYYANIFYRVFDADVCCNLNYNKRSDSKWKQPESRESDDPGTASS